MGNGVRKTCVRYNELPSHLRGYLRGVSFGAIGASDDQIQQAIVNFRAQFTGHEAADIGEIDSPRMRQLMRSARTDFTRRASSSEPRHFASTTLEYALG